MGQQDSGRAALKEKQGMKAIEVFHQNNVGFHWKCELHHTWEN